MTLIRIYCIGLAMLLGACSADMPASYTVRVGLAQAPMSLDPRFATDAASQRVQEFLHRGLIRMDAHFQPQADVAERWEHPDPLTWRFFLRRDARFHDGTPLRAADVKATLQSILDERTKSPLRTSFSAINEIKPVSDYELILRLKRPDASLLTRLSIGILPEGLARKPHQARQTIGSGPFRLVAWKDDGELMIGRVQQTSATVRNIRFIIIRDPVTRCLKMARGEIDFMQSDLPPHLLPFLRDLPDITIASRASTTFTYIGFNLKDSVLDDVRVRRALAMSLDRRKLKKALLGDLPVLAETVLTPEHWAATQVQATSYDPVAAGKLFDQAGFPRRQDGFRMRLIYRTSTNPIRLRLATAMADQWRRIGVEVKIESLDWGGFYARIKQGDFQLYSLSWVGVNDPDIYQWILHTAMWPPQGANRGRYSNPRVDAWLDEAAHTEKQDVRKRLYAQIQQQMSADQVYIPLWYEPVIAVQGSRLRDFRPQANGSLLSLIQARLKE